MKKPAGYDTTEAFAGDFKTITPGGHVCKIANAKVETAANGNEYLSIMFDIVEGDCKAFYTEQYNQRKINYPDTKFQGVFRQFYEGESLKFFKAMITAIENSNPGYTWNWDESTLKNKLFGGVFGQEEYLKDREIKLATKCMFIRTVEQVRKGVPVPKIKPLKNTGSTFGGAVTAAPANVFPEDEIPF